MDINTVVSFIKNENDTKISTVEDLKKTDKSNAYAEFISMEEAKRRLIVPAQYHDYFNNKCTCGSEFMIKESLTYVQCCNPKCKVKMAYRLSNMLENFGLKGISEKTCMLIMSSYDHLNMDITHIQAFCLSFYQPPVCITNTAKGDLYITHLRDIVSKKYTFGELISKLAIPDFGSQAADIFAGIDNLDVLHKKYSSYKDFFYSRGVYDIKKINNFITYIPDIVLISTLLDSNIRNQGLQRIPICITGSVSPNGQSMNKNEFIALLNASSCTKSGIQLYEFSMSSAMHSVPYIVADYRSSYKKYIVGEQRGVLISSTQLLNMVRELVNKVDEQ